MNTAIAVGDGKTLCTTISNSDYDGNVEGVILIVSTEFRVGYGKTLRVTIPGGKIEGSVEGLYAVLRIESPVGDGNKMNASRYPEVESRVARNSSQLY